MEYFSKKVFLEKKASHFGGWHIRIKETLKRHRYSCGEFKCEEQKRFTPTGVKHCSPSSHDLLSMLSCDVQGLHFSVNLLWRCSMFLGSYTLMLTMFAVYISSTSSSLNFSKYIISKINVIALRKLSITGRTLPTFCCHLRMWWCTPTAATSLPLERQDPGPRPPRPSPSRVPRPPASRPHRTWL